MDGPGFKFYENPRYIDNRIDKKTLIIDVNSSEIIANSFTLTLEEPITINKESEIYLDSFTTFNAVPNVSAPPTNFTDNMGFILDISEFNIQTISTKQEQNGKIIIPNGETTAYQVTIHKGKKLNYICSINPTKISSITGKITTLDGVNGVFGTGVVPLAEVFGRFIAEFIIVSKKD